MSMNYNDLVKGISRLTIGQSQDLQNEITQHINHMAELICKNLLLEGKSIMEIARVLKSLTGATGLYSCANQVKTWNNDLSKPTKEINQHE